MMYFKKNQKQPNVLSQTAQLWKELDECESEAITGGVGAPAIDEVTANFGKVTTKLNYIISDVVPDSQEVHLGTLATEITQSVKIKLGI